ncbi:MAG: NAD(P)/FAD-dependent oxidoreductase [Acidimicrobiia bacterium]|nr:NAD(P)/FAD-dependent oxidoreductase [Acidimicrobiia bacterium]
MKHLVVLGAGTAGTMVVNKLRPHLSRSEWKVTIVDPATEHHYQPGYLFVPFGTYRPEQVVKPTKRFIPAGVELVQQAVEKVDTEANTVLLAGGDSLTYDQLVIATGTAPRPDETPGLDGPETGKTVHHFYTLEAATALRDALADFEGGKVVINLIDLPIKCPVAPLEFTFLAESFFAERGMRDQVEITYVTPLEGAFTKPVASRELGDMLASKKIDLEPDFYLERVDQDEKKIVSYDEREIDYDLLVSIPLNFGADFVAASGLGDELNHVKVDHYTFLADGTDNVFAVGDAAALPTSKAGSVAHFAIDIFTENFLEHIEGREMTHAFDGHANCYIESGYGKAMLIDFNYTTQPLKGKFPMPGVGPFSLLEETEMNHFGKMMFKWIYWNILLPGKELPLPALMSMAGKVPEEV